MSNAERLRRYAQTQKFYATLPYKIDESVEEYLAAIEDAQLKEWEFWEELEGETPLGGEMRSSFKLIKDNTHGRDNY